MKSSKLHWTADEDMIYINLYQKFGKQFENYADSLPGRTVNQIRSHFYNLQYKLNGRSSSSQALDIFQIDEKLSNKWSQQEQQTFQELQTVHQNNFKAYLEYLPNKTIGQIKYMYEKQKVKPQTEIKVLSDFVDKKKKSEPTPRDMDDLVWLLENMIQKKE